MKFEKPKNPNYCGTIVKIEKIVPLEGCDNIVAAIIYGNSVIVGKNTQIGDIGIYFNAETELSKDLVSKNNLYRDSSMNEDNTKKGYFDQNRRIKIAKFKGHKSEGLFLPVNCLAYLKGFKSINNWESLVGTDFDTIDEVLICKKYVIKEVTEATKKNKSDKKKVNKFNRLVEDQFRLHVDTVNARKNIYQIKPEDVISITEKIHGTSFVVGKVLVNEKLTWLKAMAKRLFPKHIKDNYYDVIYSSRKVIKNKFVNEAANGGFYDYDLWKDIAEELAPSLQNGVTLYGECVGQLPNGKWIQAGYHYGTKPNQHKNYIYRITYTNSEGKAIELSWPQIKEYCNKYGIDYVPEHYYGMAKNFCPSIPVETHWHENFLGKLESTYVTDHKCPMNNLEVWAEGIVIRKDELFDCTPLKLKSFAFLKKESDDMDKGMVDMETSESENEPETE